MKNRTRKDTICLLIGLLLAVLGMAIIFDAYMETTFKDLGIDGNGFWQKYKFYSHWSDCFEDKNFCDKYKQDCKERNGIWLEDKRYCKFEDKQQ